MLSVRLLRTSAAHRLKHFLINHNHRSLCLSQPQPLQNHPSNPSSPHPHNKPSSENPSSHTNSKIPDIPSTSWSSIGFEQQDANDPNKWKKFAWKYAGAILLFFISYKTLHWYTDRLEADGKRRRKEMEENRDIAEQLKTPDPSSVQSFPFLEPAHHPPQLPKTTSELHELYAYKAQLEQTLQQLRSQSRTTDVKADIKHLQTELNDLAAEIHLLEANNSPS